MSNKVSKSYELRETFICGPCRAKRYVVLLQPGKDQFQELICKQCKPKGRKWPERCERCVKAGRDCDPGRNAPRVGGQESTVISSGETMDGLFDHVMGLPVSTSDNHGVTINSARPRDDCQLTTGLNRGIFLDQGEAHVYPVNLYLREYNTCNVDWSLLYEVGNMELDISTDETNEGTCNETLSQLVGSRVISVQSGTQFSHTSGSVTAFDIYPMLGPTDMTSHNYRLYMIWRLENRVLRLWGCYKTFADTGVVSDMFSQRVSCFFRDRCKLFRHVRQAPSLIC
jgi:hypothetical protein